MAVVQQWRVGLAVTDGAYVLLMLPSIATGNKNTTVLILLITDSFPSLHVYFAKSSKSWRNISGSLGPVPQTRREEDWKSNG